MHAMNDVDGPLSDVPPLPALAGPGWLQKTRAKLAGSAALAAVSAVSGASSWITAVILLNCLLIPTAIWAVGGAQALRALFLTPHPAPATINRKEEPA
jgi:hypothetical protein